MKNKRLDEIKANSLFKEYYDFLVSENEKYNLTSITIEEEVYIKHFYDSLYLENVIDLDKELTLCDVGSGAGFPSIPLKIMHPSLHITIIEPTLKRCNFLNELVNKLNLDNVKVINARAEDSKELRASFDIVSARAVSNLPILSELCIPLVKTNGFFVALKGSNYQEEIDISKHALKELNSSIEDIVEYSLEEYGNHAILMIKKNAETKPIYPRLYSQIKKKPL